MALIDFFLSKAFKRGVLTVHHADGSTRSFGKAEPGFPNVTIRFADKGVAGEILRDPAMGAAETFMDGRLIIEQGDILDLVTMISAGSRWQDGKSAINPSFLGRLKARALHRIGRRNMAVSAKRNVAHHYDLSARLYDLFLDRDRQYSCAYFTDPANSLEQAQLDKKAHIAAKLAIEPGMKVLDIGCGWGGMALYLHKATGAEVTGITLSEEQLKIARQRAADAGVADKVHFELIDYRELNGQFDRIVSVGMFEHVGTPQFRTFFQKCFELLTPKGVMLLHTIGRSGKPGVTDRFTLKYIFPGGYIPSLSEIAQGYEGLRWYLTDVEVLRLHYAHTLQHWYDRTTANKDAIVALYDERFFRMWQYYLAGALTGFKYRGLVNFQLQFSRDLETLPITRDYMLEAEPRLRQAG